MTFSMLKAIGFTDEDAKVYELLVKSGEAKRTDLMSKAKLPKKDFDRVLAKLVAYGAAEEIGADVSATSPKTFLQKYYVLRETDSEMKLTELRGNIEEIKRRLEPVYSEKRLGMRLEEIWEVLDGLPAMEVETVKMVSRAKDEICIFAEQFSWFNKIREELISALDRKVKIKVLILVDGDIVKERVEEMKLMGIEVRHADCNWRNTRYTIVDNGEMVFLIWARKSANSRIFYRPGYTKNPGMVCVFRDSFELLWEKSKPF